jgi:hypothetical protein
MRRGLAIALALVTTSSAHADPPALGYGALPGGLHAPSAETLAAGTFGASVIGGYGRRTKLLAAEHKLTRSLGELAFAYAPTGALSLALSFDGRYDKHTGGLTPGGDDGYVGDPHLLARYATRRGTIAFGAQLGVRVPGKDAPSVALGATTLDVRALAELPIGPVRVALDAGFRLDNSAKSIDDAELGRLSVEDRISLGVSDFHAVVAGVHVAIPIGRAAFAGGEASADVFVGGGSPDPILRAGGLVGTRLGDTWQVYAFVEAARVPSIDAAMAPLVPYEPAVTGGLGIAARFGGRGVRTGTGTIDITDTTPPVVEQAQLGGTVVDDLGKPAAGATVTITVATKTATAVADERGGYAIEVPAGQAEITATGDGKKPRSITLVLVKGANTAPPLVLDPVLPPGQLRAVVRTAAGRPIANATVRVEPGGLTATSDADGNVTIDLAPGTYRVTASSANLKDQSLDLVIEKDGVVVKNFELRR